MAFNYGWGKEYILEHVYFDELYYLLEQIKRRKLADYKMQLAIVQNPHAQDPKALWQALSEDDHRLLDDKFDAKGFARFKATLAGSGRIQVK